MTMMMMKKMSERKYGTKACANTAQSKEIRIKPINWIKNEKCLLLQGYKLEIKWKNREKAK